MRILLADSPPKTPPRRNNNSSNGDDNDDDWRQNVFLSQSVSLYVVNDSFIVLLTSIFTITKPRWSNRTNDEFSCCFAVRQRLCRLQEKDSVKWFVLCAGGGGGGGSCDFGITRRKNYSQAANTEAKNGGVRESCFELQKKSYPRVKHIRCIVTPSSIHLIFSLSVCFTRSKGAVWLCF